MANSGAAVLRIDQDITGFGHFMRFIYYKKKTNVLLLIITNQHGKSCGPLGGALACSVVLLNLNS